MAVTAVVGGAVIGAGASIYASEKSSSAAKNAANAQESAAARQAAIEQQRLDMAKEQWDYYKTNYQPLEGELIEAARTGVDADAWVGRASTDVNQSFDNAQAIESRNLGRYGVNPNSGRATGLARQSTLARATADANARNQTRQAIDETNWNRRLQVQSLGKGIPAQVSATMSSAANGIGNAGQQAANSAWNTARMQGAEATAAANAVGRIAQSIPWGNMPAVSTWGNSSGYSGVNTGSAQDAMLAEQTAGFDGAGAYSFADGGLIGRDGGLRRFADGGPVDADGYVQGPGTPTSDSIPALIDGQQPAALSTDEYVIPADVVRAKGTEFFDKLVSQYHTPVNRGLRRGS